MKAGELRHRVTLQQRSGADDALGQATITWGDVATVWASVQGLTGRELLASSAERAEDVVIIRMRYLGSVATSKRVIWNGGTYDIININDVDTRHRMLELTCKRGVSNG